MDESCAGALHDTVVATLAHGRPQSILIDMRHVDATDSKAFGMLVMCQRAAATAGTILAVVNRSPLIWRVLWASGLCGLFHLVPDPPR